MRPAETEAGAGSGRARGRRLPGGVERRQPTARQPTTLPGSQAFLEQQGEHTPGSPRLNYAVYARRHDRSEQPELLDQNWLVIPE